VGNWKVGFASISSDVFFGSSLKSGVLNRVSTMAVAFLLLDDHDSDNGLLANSSLLPLRA
jgi:hypothetical protein